MIPRLPLYVICIMTFCSLSSLLAWADDSSLDQTTQQIALNSRPDAQKDFQVDTSSNTTDKQTDTNDNKSWEFSQSVKYSRGKYGTSQESETYEEDSSLQRDFANAMVSVTIPSLWQTGNVIATAIGRQIINKRTVKTATNSIISPTIAGLGDISLSGSYYLLEEGRNSPVDVTLTAYLKTPTASVKDGLGSGAWDGGPGIGFTKKIIDHIKAVADASYTFIGKVPGEETRNQVSLDGGLEYDITPATSATVKYEYSNATTKGGPNSQDIALSINYKINDDWKINGEVDFGLTHGSADETYLLGASVSFAGGILGLLPSPNAVSSNTSDYQTASSFFEPISTRFISDPLFLPLKGQLYGATAYTYSLAHSSTYNYLGKNTAKSSVDTNTFTQNIQYGISDRLTLRLIDSYAFNKAAQSVSTTGAVTNNNNEGFNNPTIGTIYRVLEQPSFPADVDLTFNISPSAFSAKEAGSGRNGTVASGTQPIAVVTGIGREMKNFTIEGTFTTTYVGNKYYESYANDDNYLEQEYFNYSFGLNTQTRLTERLSINLGAGYTITDHAYLTNLSTGTKVYVTIPNTFDLTGSINYHFIPNRLVGALTYTYDDYSTGKNTYSAVTSDTESRNHYANVFGARMQYLF
ncbi:MAG: hypothetical protein HQL14_03520 [Candidatus Omnitrophica bacterium]|nr:hypothetical protein [Candidatus Omnitrophota bacterium]